MIRYNRGVTKCDTERRREGAMATEDYKDRNTKIKEAMGGADHTRVELARLLGINRMSVTRKLNGESEWKVSELEKLAEIYETDKTYFF